MPHVRQEPDFCGEACAEMWLNKLGKKLDQDFVFNQSGLDPALGRGCYTADLVRALTAIGFHVGPVWQTVPLDDRARKVSKPRFRELHADLVAGIPSIVCMHYDDRPNTTEHFRLVLGYDARTDEVIYNEPAEAHGAYRRMPREMFLKLWPLRSSDKASILVRIRLESDKLIDAPPRGQPAAARSIAGRFRAAYFAAQEIVAGGWPISRLSCNRRLSSSETNRRRP